MAQKKLYLQKWSNSLLKSLISSKRKKIALKDSADTPDKLLQVVEEGKSRIEIIPVQNDISAPEITGFQRKVEEEDQAFGTDQTLNAIKKFTQKI